MAIKTLHLTNAYHDRSGGIRTMYHALMDQAARERRQIRLIVPGADDGEVRINPYATVYRVRAPLAPAFDRRYRFISPSRFLPAGRGRVWQIIGREAPDVMEICDKYSLCYLAGLLRRRRRSPGDGPTLIGLSCERLDDNIGAYVISGAVGAAAARAYLGRVYIGMFDAHAANSVYTAGELHRAMRAPHLRPVHVVPMGVDVGDPIDDRRRAALRAEVRAGLGLDADSALVLYAGRVSPEKQVEALVRVGARLTGLNAHLLIAGDGPSRPDLEASCGRAAPGVCRFLGHVDKDRLSGLLAASDVFVHPNSREPFGIGPLEAMAAGLPVVLPRAGGVLTYATDQNAWLADSATQLADGVAAVLEHPHLARMRAAAARATAERCSRPSAAARMFRVYDAIHDARLRRSTNADHITANRRPAIPSSV
jgi:alpha-1,6-mannosyltransferase